MSDFFEYKFRATGGGSAGSQHCTYCPKQMGEVSALSCGNIYAALKAEREADGVTVNDEPTVAAFGWSADQIQQFQNWWDHFMSGHPAKKPWLSHE